MPLCASMSGQLWQREPSGATRLSERGMSICPCINSFFPPTQEISGWYYLLGEDLGRTKHLKVASRRLKQSRVSPLGRPRESWQGSEGE